MLSFVCYVKYQGHAPACRCFYQLGVRSGLVAASLFTRTLLAPTQQSQYQPARPSNPCPFDGGYSLCASRLMHVLVTWKLTGLAILFGLSKFRGSNIKHCPNMWPGAPELLELSTTYKRKLSLTHQLCRHPLARKSCQQYADLFTFVDCVPLPSLCVCRPRLDLSRGCHISIR